MPGKKQKTAIWVGVAVLLALALSLLVVKHEHKVHLERVCGTWEATLRHHAGPLMRNQRMVLRIFKDSQAYRAVMDEIDVGRKNIPATRLAVGGSSVDFGSDSGFTYKGALNGEATEITGRWYWPNGKFSLPLTFDRTTTPDVVQEPIAEADYTPRPGSDLQGLWKGTLTMQKTPLRLHLKIAESNGNFRAELNSIDQPPVLPLPATTLDYRRPHVKLSFQGIGAAFDGNVDESGTKLSGKWTQYDSVSLSFERANPKDELAASTAGQTFDPDSEADLQGHWRGLLPGKFGVSLHVVFNIARLPDGSFSGTLDSPDQSLFAMPFNLIAFEPPKVRMEIKSANCTFDGTLLEGKLSGTWTFKSAQKTTTEPLTLERGKSS